MCKAAVGGSSASPCPPLPRSGRVDAHPRCWTESSALAGSSTGGQVTPGGLPRRHRGRARPRPGRAETERPAGLTAGGALSCPERPPAGHDADQPLGFQPFEYPADHSRAHPVVVRQCGHGGHGLTAAPLPRSDASAQVSLYPLAWPLRSPLHTVHDRSRESYSPPLSFLSSVLPELPELLGSGAYVSGPGRCVNTATRGLTGGESGYGEPY